MLKSEGSLQILHAFGKIPRSKYWSLQSRKSNQPQVLHTGFMDEGKCQYHVRNSKDDR